MKSLFVMAAALAAACAAGAAEVGRTETPIRVDGRLDEAAWGRVRWEDGFRRVKSQEAKGPLDRRTEFAFLADANALYVGVRCFEPDLAAVRNRPDNSLWMSDDVELFLSPGGTSFDYSHFAVSPNSKDVFASYLSEGGNITPDPYAPLWEHAIGYEKDCWTAEFAFPLSAFYMTRNAEWKTKWLVNVARTMQSPSALATFAPLQARFHESKNFVALDGFPVRTPDQDLAVRAVSAEMSGIRDGMLAGTLRLDVWAARAGEYLFRTSASGEVRRVALRGGDNRVSLPCAYAANGRHPTRITLRRLPDGPETGRDYPVMVDFQPIRVKLTTPQYRNNFYPGQDVSRVRGTVSVAGGDAVTLVLEGPGLAPRTQTLAAGGEFEFDTAGMEKGDAWLTVTAGRETKKVRIRNLPETGRRMAWIADGNLVVNGRPTLRRNIYADGYLQGLMFKERYNADLANFWMTPECGDTVGLEMDRLIPGLERREGVRDVKPCAEYLAKIDAAIEANRDRDFTAYYLSDEPECRNISPVYLKHVYDYVAERDPYHPVFSATRGGKAYIECVDWAETHPYLNCRVPDENGVRAYGRHPNEVGRFLDAFEAWDRPDKCIGFLPTCFAYRWSSSRNDYPTLDEYVLHTWAAMMRGGKTLWPYAGHDLGDRPSLYEGTKYVFSSFAALERIVLHGTRTTFARSPDEEGVLYELPDEKMFVLVNFTPRPRRIALPGVTGSFREFRGTRTWRTDGPLGRTLEPIELRPLETVVACTADHDAGLPSLAEVRALVDRQEAERKGRDNQLRGRYDDLVADSNMKANFGGGFYKLIDGTRDMLARYASWMTNAQIEVSFTKFTPRFSKVRVWGAGIETLAVDVRQGGAWRTLTPRSAVREKWMTELDFGDPVTTVKMRFRFPMKPGKNRIEVYELELPNCADGAETAARKGVAAAADAGVKWRLTGTDAACTNVWHGTLWYGNSLKAVRPTATGGFVVSERVTRYFPMDPAHRWIVMDIAGFRDKDGGGYRAWFASLGKGGRLGSTVTHPQAGIYTFRLPPTDRAASDPFRFDIYGLEAEFNSIACMSEPANRVELSCTGGVARVRAVLASPAEEATGEFLVARSTGDLRPFPVNGGHCVELKPLDAEGRVWGADVEVRACAQAEPRSVYVKVSALGSDLKRPIFGNFAERFEAR